MKKNTLLVFYLVFLPLLITVLAAVSEAENNKSQKTNPYPAMPVYITELPNINDYDIFANSGWDGNWYVGYNVCWIKRFPSVPEGRYVKAQIGAKMGRAKTQRVPDKPAWEKEPIKGTVYIAISSTPAWRSDCRYYLASAEDMPLEGDAENALGGTGESRWFWAEIPLDRINFQGENYIALWSPNQYFVSRDSSPILCGGWGVKNPEANTWLNDEIQGAPPIDVSNSLKTPISVFEPAIALKLIPDNSVQDIPVEIVAMRETRGRSQVILASIYGSQIDRAWLEYADAELGGWKKTGRYIYQAPYTFTLNPAGLPEGKISVRIACEDAWLNRGYSTPFEIFVQ